MLNDQSRRSFLKSLGLGALVAGTSSSLLNAAAVPKDRPNIIFIFSDDHAFGAISAYGGRLAKVAPTPNIDRLANEGVLFNKSYVSNSICAPARAVILTGKHSHLNGVLDNGNRLDGSQPTFTKCLQSNGYQTAIVGKWHLKSEPIGFDYWNVLPGQGAYYNPDFRTPDGKVRVEGYVTDIVTDKALNWLDKDRDKSKPFMLMLQHKAPHRPWEPPVKYLDLFDGVDIPEPKTLFDNYATRGTAAHEQDMTIDKTMTMGYDLKVWDDKVATKKRIPHHRMTPEQIKDWDAALKPENDAFKKAGLKGKCLVRWKYQRYVKNYLRCIRSVDDNVGRVLDYLDKSGLAKNTVVVYSSDQGFYLGEHGWFDKRFMYKESFRTPLLARWPGVTKPGTVNNDLVQNLDLAQTFLDIANVPQPAEMQGVSIKPLLHGQAPANWRKSLYYHYYEFPGVHNVNRHEGVATKRYKLIHFYQLKEWELYDLDNDPSELRNQYANPQYAPVVASLKKELIRLRTIYKVPENVLVDKKAKKEKPASKKRK